MQHSFDINIAEKYGVNVAIFLNNMYFWIKHNTANEKNFYDGRYWTYNSVRAYAALFPYWSQKQVRTIIDQCISHGLILKGNYNEHKYDQTQWYAFTDLAANLLNLAILPNGQMDFAEKANVFDRKGKPIPDIKPDSKPDKREPAEKRVPLSPDFQPNAEVKELLKITADRCRITRKELQDKFIAIHGDELSNDWNKKIKIFLMREKPSSNRLVESGQSQVSSTIKEWGPGHPSYDSLHGTLRN